MKAHGIPASACARYESNPDKIPMGSAWQLADVLCTTVDAAMGREESDPASTRGEMHLGYDGLTPEAWPLADELREFVLMKDAKICAHGYCEEVRPYEVLCCQYGQQMLSRMRDSAAFGELVTFGSSEMARFVFEPFLQEWAVEKCSGLSVKAQQIVEDQVIEKIMAVYNRARGEFECESMWILWDSVDCGVMVEDDTEANRRAGDVKSQKEKRVGLRGLKPPQARRQV